jgi:hypothetical protein
MNLQQIREECWTVARELNTPDADRLWNQAEMNQYINRIYRKIARETRCIRDARTPAIVLLSLAVVDHTTLVQGTDGLDYIWANDENSPIYQADLTPYVLPLHKSIIDIDEVKIVEKGHKLIKVSSEKWQDNVLWEQSTGIPTEYATDLQLRSIAVNYRSIEALTLQLAVKRLPLADLAGDADEPEFREDYHDFFKNGVLELMYGKNDAEAFDGPKMGSYRKKFLADLDEIKQAETKLNEKLSPNYAMEGHR